MALKNKKFFSVLYFTLILEIARMARIFDPLFSLFIFTL